MIPIALKNIFNFHQAIKYKAWNDEQVIQAMKVLKIKSSDQLEEMFRNEGIRSFTITPVDDDFIITVKNNVTGSVLDLTDQN